MSLFLEANAVANLTFSIARACTNPLVTYPNRVQKSRNFMANGWAGLRTTPSEFGRLYECCKASSH